LSINTRQPEHVVVGSSRVLQMRAVLLTEQPDSIYNAGAPATTLTHILDLLNSIETPPKMLLLGIDADCFNDAYVPDVFPAQVDDLRAIFNQNTAVAKAALTGRPVDISELVTRREPGYGGLALGIKAIENGHGFRNDGSEQYGDFLIGRFLDPAAERQRHLDWMRQGEQMYVYGDRVSEHGIQQMIDILEWAEANEVQVIGFMPPFAPELYQRMLKRGNHTYIEQLIPKLETLFAEYGFAFFDFSGGGDFGVHTDFFDGWHGSERVYLHLYEEMLDALPDILGAYSDEGILSDLDAAAPDTWHVFGQ
ncbi:MAG: hypothetical protein H7X77_02410, partial [Anaerolineae bacterium]|nr:hypothetical protein [Anaerolineae bacterium]